MFGLRRRKGKSEKRSGETPVEPGEARANPQSNPQVGPLRRLGKIAEAVNRPFAERAAEREKSAADREREDMREILAQIRVVAFIGPSGTGKSTRAITIARHHRIDYLIDDGLLIHGSRVVAGTSAKRAVSKLDSVRQALFADATRAAVMRRTLSEHQPSALMILGTSEGMLLKICQNLWLNQPSERIRIEDVSSEEEMRQAREIRQTEGRHTIPVPSMEIKHEFSGYLADPLNRRRRRRDRTVTGVPADSERTVVRPTFSSLGSYSISDDAMRRLIELILGGIPGVDGLVSCTTRNDVYGVVFDLDLALRYGHSAPQVLRVVQETVGRQVEALTAINVLAVNVKARRVTHPAGEPAQQPVEQP